MFNRKKDSKFKTSLIYFFRKFTSNTPEIMIYGEGTVMYKRVEAVFKMEFMNLSEQTIACATFRIEAHNLKGEKVCTALSKQSGPIYPNSKALIEIYQSDFQYKYLQEPATGCKIIDIEIVYVGGERMLVDRTQIISVDKVKKYV